VKAGWQQIVWLRVIGLKSQVDLLDPHHTLGVNGYKLHDPKL
jgi:hypothetical protein